MRDQIILAPHVDDEVIGCYSSLVQSRVAAVVYGSNISYIRLAEAKEAANSFGYTVLYDREVTWKESLTNFLELNKHTKYELLMPCGYDHHREHRIMEQEGRIFAREKALECLFYSVDMDVPFISPLVNVHAELKKDYLYKLFPSQRAYFDTHEQAWLFESIRGISTNTTITKNFHPYELSVDITAYTKAWKNHALKTLNEYKGTVYMPFRKISSTYTGIDYAVGEQTANLVLHELRQMLVNAPVDIGVTYLDVANNVNVRIS